MARCVSKTSEWKKCRSKVPFLLFIYSLYPLSSFRLVYAFANVLMRCVVTMVSNVSDSLDAWPGMLLHAHMLQHSLMPQGAGHTHTHAHIHSVHAYLCACTVHKEYVCKSAKWRLSGRSSCSFLLENRNFLLPLCKPWLVSQDINQSAMLRLMQEVSLTASRRKTQKYYEATR